MLRSAAERQFEILGEATTRLAKLDSALVAEITECRRMIAFRNVLNHGYVVIDDQITWNVIQTKVGVLATDVRRLLDRLDSLESGGAGSP